MHKSKKVHFRRTLSSFRLETIKNALDHAPKFATTFRILDDQIQQCFEHRYQFSLQERAIFSPVAVMKNSLNTLLNAPTCAQLRTIRRNINEECEDKLRHNERHMQQWISYQRHFPQKIDAKLVRNVLRANKHVLDRTKRKLEQQLAARHIYPEFFQNRSPFSQEIERAMSVVNIAYMPSMTQNGERIAVFSLNRFEAAQFNSVHVIKLVLMIFDLVLSSEHIYAGDIAIFDGAHFSAAHVAQYLGPHFNTIMTILKEAYSIRLKEIHVINAPSLLVHMLAIIKPLLHPSLRRSIHIHENPSQILEIFGAQNLPSNYGGQLRTLRKMATDWYDAVSRHADWFQAQESVQISAVPQKTRSQLHSPDQMGLEGSFRQLNID
uniref:CRAL-TRIO domain-containing protein n=1 Tax=Dendroctonus ponderosae TaxID=77166 RepID=A0AAR5Q460_DENPD